MDTTEREIQKLRTPELTTLTSFSTLNRVTGTERITIFDAERAADDRDHAYRTKSRTWSTKANKNTSQQKFKLLLREHAVLSV